MNNHNWKNYYLKSGDDFSIFWEKFFQVKKRNVLFVLGKGFDPRMCNCLELINQKVNSSIIKCMTINLEGSASSENEIVSKSFSYNIDKLNEIVPESEWIPKTITMFSDGMHVGSIQAASIIKKDDLEGFTDIIVDISALPQNVYFPIIATILDQLEKKLEESKEIINFHIVTSENAMLDGMISDSYLDETASFLHKFRGTVSSEGKRHLKKIWIPILGEKQKNQVTKIFELIKPQEICPVFPMPSKDPYRNKKLLLEHSEFLFDNVIGIETGNFIYVNEQNPFETYNKIIETSEQYYYSFKPLKGCHIVLSSLSSKLLSVGVLLAAYDLMKKNQNIGVAHVENQNYDIDENINIEKERNDSKPFTLWVFGEPYEE